MLYQYSDPALKALTRAGKFAEQQQTACVDSPHLFLGILEESNDDPIISNLLKISGVSVEEARLYAESAMEANPVSPQKTSLSASAQLILEYASNEALRDGKKVIEVEHLFIACIRSQRGPHVGAVLRPLGLDADKLRQHLRALSSKPAPYRLGSPLNTLTDSSNLSIEAAQKLTRSSFWAAHFDRALIAWPAGNGRKRSHASAERGGCRHRGTSNFDAGSDRERWPNRGAPKEIYRSLQTRSGKV